MVVVAKVWTRSLRAPGGKFQVMLDDGHLLVGIVHSEFENSADAELVARLLDLKRAYKQLGLDPADVSIAVFALLNGNGDWEFYESLVLGFGARNAVLGFNLAARAIRHFANVGLALPVTHYFDDFAQIDPRALAKSSASAFERLLKLFG